MIISTFKTIILAENEHLKCIYCSGTVNKPKFFNINKQVRTGKLPRQCKQLHGRWLLCVFLCNWYPLLAVGFAAFAVLMLRPSPLD